jgi:hypothetical protein
MSSEELEINLRKVANMAAEIVASGSRAGEDGAQQPEHISM